MGKKQLQWNLTPDECAQLRERFFARIGNEQLIDALARSLGARIRAEAAWWEALILRLGLSEEDAKGLVAHWEIGKVWVKGKVKELDNLPANFPQDNPHF